jgi:uncharacterized protein YaiI (UPF0178 family)
LLEIFVDADACPVKDEIYVVATRYGVPVTLVTNAAMFVPDGMGVELVVVGRDPDAADDWIVRNLRPGDIVVTADVPLAARSLEAGARALGTTGREFDRENIGGALASRELMSQLRESGEITGGPRSMSPRDRSRFLSALDALVQRELRR